MLWRWVNYCSIFSGVIQMTQPTDLLHLWTFHFLRFSWHVSQWRVCCPGCTSWWLLCNLFSFQLISQCMMSPIFPSSPAIWFHFFKIYLLKNLTPSTSSQNFNDTSWWFVADLPFSTPLVRVLTYRSFIHEKSTSMPFRAIYLLPLTPLWQCPFDWRSLPNFQIDQNHFR